MLLQGQGSPHGTLDTLINGNLCPLDALVGNPAALVHKCLGCGGGVGEALLAQLVGAVFEFGQHAFQQLDSHDGLVVQRLGGLQRLLVPGLESFNHDVEPASTSADDLLGRLGASGADRLKGRECAGNARVLAEVDIVFDKLQAALQLGQEQVDLEQQVLLALHDVADNRLSPRDKE